MEETARKTLYKRENISLCIKFRTKEREMEQEKLAKRVVVNGLHLFTEG